MIEYFLAFVFLGALLEGAPIVKSGHATHEDCAIARLRAIKQHEDLLNLPETQAKHGAFVCLKMEPTT